MVLSRYLEKVHDSSHSHRATGEGKCANKRLGRHSCVGQSLARDIIRLVTAALVKKYHIDLAPGETGNRIMEDLRDQFTSYPS